MESKIHSKLRVFELDIGGAVVIPAEGLGPHGKDVSDPLGLSLWASKVDTNKW